MMLTPTLKGKSRPHMLLPTAERYLALTAMLELLFKLKVLNNRDVLYIAAYTQGVTYYHKSPDIIK